MIEIIKQELEGLYGDEVLRDMNEIISLYGFYEGKGQDWPTPLGLDYVPTKKKTNWTKKLIKEEARFLFGKTPEFKVISENKEGAQVVQDYVNNVLKESLFADNLVKGARDCFIGKRVALKLSGGAGQPIKVHFKPSLEFVFEPQDEDVDELKSIVFFFQMNQSEDKSKQRVWKQRYHMDSKKCILNEGIYDGYGRLVEERYTDYDTGLSFIPAYVIINDGLTGDLKGESDVAELMDNQQAFNRLSSDDVDALRFNMFPQTVATNASEDSLKYIKIAPGALVDLQKAVEADGGVDMKKLESQFGYGDKLEKTLNRTVAEMHEILNVPRVGLEELKGLMTSGKSMKALYWQLVTRCEEKYTAWRPALEWMAKAIIEMAKAYNLESLPELPGMQVQVENIYPLMEDEADEKTLDMQAVNTQVMSKKSYMTKWGSMPADEADEELKQIALEKSLLEDSYMKGLDDGADQ